jgi:hypothetical protein
MLYLQAIPGHIRLRESKRAPTCADFHGSGLRSYSEHNAVAPVHAARAFTRPLERPVIQPHVNGLVCAALGNADYLSRATCRRFMLLLVKAACIVLNRWCYE